MICKTNPESSYFTQILQNNKMEGILGDHQSLIVLYSRHCLVLYIISFYLTLIATLCSGSYFSHCTNEKTKAEVTQWA